jgi:hypothetical protein
MRFHEVLWDSMRFYDDPVNRSVLTEANRDLTSYTMSLPLLFALPYTTLSTGVYRSLQHACAPSPLLFL